MRVLSLRDAVERVTAGLRANSGFAVFIALFAVRVAAGESLEGGEEEEEEVDPMALGIAATLMGAVSFQMGLFYLTNHQDDDMRKYSYEILNATISIFSAVMLFQTCDDLVSMYFLKGLSPWMQSLAHMIHMLTWYSILQFSLAYISGAIGSEPKSKYAMELNMKSVAVILAHLTGFASINAWGSLQQLPVVSVSPWRVAAVVPVSFMGQFLLQRFTNKIRDFVALGDDGKKDEWEIAWIEETAEAENDVMGLTLSFNLTQAARFFIIGVMPDRHGKLEIVDGNEELHSLCLIVVGLIAAVCMTAIFMFSREGEDVEEGAQEQLEMGDKEEEEKEESLASRMRAAAVLTLGMTFAWCLFFASRQALKYWWEEEMVLSVVLALAISLVSFGCIRGLDVLADADCTGQRTDDAIVQIIGAFGILVGFGWEQCFDVAVEELSEAMPERTQHGIKMALGLFCVCIITPAWKWHLLPMALRQGWKFGFVIDPHDHKAEEKWDNIINHVEEKLHNSVHHHHVETCKKMKSGRAFPAEEKLRQDREGARQEELARLREEHESLQRDLRIVKESVSKEKLSPTPGALETQILGDNEESKRLKELTQPLLESSAKEM